MLDRSGIAIEGKEAVIVGRSNIVGKPLALMLLNRHATVTICHTRTKDLGAVARRADILVAAAGKAEMVRGDMVKEGAVVIDVGINRKPDGKLVGDVAFAEARPDHPDATCWFDERKAALRSLRSSEAGSIRLR